MKEKLIIRNFGPIKNVELELGRFNVLIGENATGKSTVVKILAMCRFFSFVVGHKRRFNEGLLSYWNFPDVFLNINIDNHSFFSYDCEHYYLEYGLKGLESVFSLQSKTQKFEELLQDLDDLSPEYRTTKVVDSSYWNIPHSFFRNERLKQVMDYPLFIPAERGLSSVFALGQKTIENIAPSLYDQLDKLTNTIAKKFSEQTHINLFNTTYVNINGNGYVGVNDNNNSIHINQAATGFQSAIPIMLSLNYYYQKQVKKTFIIEEIELNLFPTKQHKLIEELALFYNIGKGFNYFITTHSPYILTALNNLMYAYTVGQSHKEEVSKIIEEKYWVNPKDVSAYQLLSDGTCIDILDKEEGMIESDKIDEVSKTLNEEFDLLQNIELGIEQNG